MSLHEVDQHEGVVTNQFQAAVCINHLGSKNTNQLGSPDHLASLIVNKLINNLDPQSTAQFQQKMSLIKT
jgi:hypothetical protein